CRLNTFEKEEVPSQRDGVIWYVGTDIAPGEVVPPELIVEHGGKRFRKLREGDFIKKDQRLAQLDDRQAQDELASKKAKIGAAEADYEASEAARRESEQRYRTGLELWRKKAIGKEELDERKLVLDKYTQEAKAKAKAIDVAKLEAN